MTIVVEQQIAEGDRVLTYMKTSLRHTGPFMGITPTGKTVSLASMRIDRIDRIEGLGGRCDIRPREGGGTVVTVSLNLQ